jgi:hypothetical protein
MKISIVGMLIAGMFILIVGAGCADTGDEGVPTVTPTPVPTTLRPTLPPDTFSLEPGPTDAIPSQKNVEATAIKDSIYGTITVEFRGGKGQYLLSDLLVTAYLSTGEVITERLGTNVNSEVVIRGTTGTDRVVVDASFVDGTHYRIFDKALGYKER